MKKWILHQFFVVLAGLLLVAVPIFTEQKPVQAATADCSDVYTPLSSFVVNGVNTNKGWYVQAMNEVGVPWEMLAAIHYRETNFSHTNPSNGQGIFQFVNGDGGPYPPGPVSDDEFYRQLKFMAGKLQNDYVWRGNLPRERRQLQPNEQNITIVKDTLYSYNGRASVYAQQAAKYGYNSSLQPYEGSPYVVNRFDCPRARMGMITRDFGSMDGIDTRYGTFTIFARLRGDTYWQSLSTSPFGDGFVLAKANDPNDLRQWVLYGNVKRYVPNADIIYAWGLNNVPLINTTSEILNSIPTGDDLTRLMRPSGTLDVYFVDDGKSYKIGTPSMFSTWGLSTADIRDVSVGLGQLPTNSGHLSFAVRDPSSSNIYMTDGLNQSNQLVLRRYQNPDLLTAWEGDNVVPTPLSAAYFDGIDNAKGLDISSAKITNANQEYLVAAGQKLPGSSTVAQLYPGVSQSVSATTLNRLVTGNAASQFIRCACSQTIYMVDRSVKYPVATPEYIRAWGNSADPSVTVVAQGNLNLLTSGNLLNTYEAELNGQLYLMDGRKIVIPAELDNSYRTPGNVFSASAELLSLSRSGETARSFIKGRQGPAVYLMDAGKRLHITSPIDLSLWNGTADVTNVSDNILAQFVSGGAVGSYVTDGTNEYMAEGAKLHPVTAAVKTNWRLTRPSTLSITTINARPRGIDLPDKLQNAGQYYWVHDGAAYGTTDTNIAAIWGVSDAPTMNPGLIDLYLGRQMLTRVAGSRVSGDSRLFIVDRGTLYRLYPNHALNLVANGPYTLVNPAILSVNDWTSAVVKDESGVNYVIDGGIKRLIPAGIIRDQWTYGNYANIPTMTNGFLNQLPNGRQIERAIKGSGPSVYSVQNFTKRWILSTQTYNSLYAPYTNVSDALLDVLPNGQNIP